MKKGDCELKNGQVQAVRSDLKHTFGLIALLNAKRAKERGLSGRVRSLNLQKHSLNSLFIFPLHYINYVAKKTWQLK